MKKILGLCLVMGLVGCSESELERLKSNKSALEKQIEQLSLESDKYHQPCIDSTTEYKKAESNGDANIDELKKKGIELCQKALNVENKSLELQEEVMNLQLAIISEELKEGGKTNEH